MPAGMCPFSTGRLLEWREGFEIAVSDDCVLFLKTRAGPNKAAGLPPPVNVVTTVCRVSGFGQSKRDAARKEDEDIRRYGEIGYAGPFEISDEEPAVVEVWFRCEDRLRARRVSLGQNLREAAKATGYCGEDWLVSQGRPVGHRTPAELGRQPEGGLYEVAVASRGHGGEFGGPGGVRERFDETLGERGVPEGVVSAMAAAAMSAMGGKGGLQKVFEGADSAEQ